MLGVMTRPRLLDLFCGAGGAARGYQMAGFRVTGVDSRPQPRYAGDEFTCADAMTFPLDGFDVIHASPPCQDHMRSPTWNSAEHGTGWMLAATRDRLAGCGIPWVIENVPGADIRVDYRLCGCMFGLRVRSERWFETSWRGFDLIPPHDHRAEVLNRFRNMQGPAFRRRGRIASRREIALAMGIDWMAGDEYKQAIPPAYTEYIGCALMEELVTPSR